MIGKIVILYFIATALGRLIIRHRHPMERISNNRREDPIEKVPKDVFEFLANGPSLRGGEDFIKLPKDVFEKWLAKNQEAQPTNDSPLGDIQSQTDVPTDNLDAITILGDYNNTDDKTINVTPEVNNDLIKKVIALKKEETNRNKNDYNKINVKQNNHSNHGSETAVKQKLMQLIKNTKSSIDKKTEPIQAIHDAHKQNRVYKIGYLVSNINRTQDSLKEFYNHVEKNIRQWDVLRALNAYDQVKTADEFLSKALYILNMVGASTFARSLNANPESTTSTSTANDGDVTDRLAWSYYDDNM
ncbi:uncharacterized protein LOC128682273 isoform X2 [Plodia interpunctella]|nr:uncharacterized protein LOC128682273 isoform X2 [Plodia interpunctella]